MKRRSYTAAMASERCGAPIKLRDGSGAQCMRRVVGSDFCRQHADKRVAEVDHIDPWVAGVIRQAVKICGLEKVRRLLDTLELEATAGTRAAPRGSSPPAASRTARRSPSRKTS